MGDLLSGSRPGDVAQAGCKLRLLPAGGPARRLRPTVHIHTRKLDANRVIAKRRVELVSTGMSSTSDVTALLVAWAQGNQAAQSELMEVVYAELKRLAKAYLRREYANRSFAATALVHEAYLKLVDQRNVRWRNRSHFYGIAAQAMRRILVDHARASQAAKRGGADAKRGVRTELRQIQEPPDVDVLALDAALSRLETGGAAMESAGRAAVFRGSVCRGDGSRAGTVTLDREARLESGARLVVPRNRCRAEGRQS